MKTLSETWFADGYIDFELKKYTLLAYLQEVNRYFNENKLYPQLADLVFHYNNLVAFRENKQFLQQHFPKRLTKVNLEKLQLVYEQMLADDELMQELEDILHYALKEMNETLQEGTGLYEFIEEKLNIAPVGLVALDNREGYMFLCDGKYSDTRVYQYRLSIFEQQHEKYRGIRTMFITTYSRNFVNTYEQIKSELIRHRNELPNPAVYSIETDLSLPLDETLLPIAKRTLVKYIATNAAKA